LNNTPPQPPLRNRNNVVEDYENELNEQEMLNESGDVPEVNWLEDRESYAHLTENDYQDSMIYFTHNINMYEQEMERIWADQYISFVDTVLAELQHNYDLRLRTTPTQPNPKVVKKAQSNKKEDQDKSTMEQ
jgi:hypothetical protein